MKNYIFKAVLFLTISLTSNLSSMPLPSLFVISKTAQKIDLIKSIYIISEISILEDKELKLTLKEHLYYNRTTNTVDLLITNLSNGKTIRVQRNVRGCSAVFNYTRKNISCYNFNSNIFYRTLLKSGLSRFLHKKLNIDFDNKSITYKRNPDKSYITPDDIKISLLNKKPVYEIGKTENKIFIDINKFNILKIVANNSSITYKNYHEYAEDTTSFPNSIIFKKDDTEANYDVKSVSINSIKPSIFDKFFSTTNTDSDIIDYLIKFR